MEFKEFGERGGESGKKQLEKSPGKFKRIMHRREVRDKSHLFCCEIHRPGHCFGKAVLNTH